MCPENLHREEPGVQSWSVRVELAPLNMKELQSALKSSPCFQAWAQTWRKVNSGCLHAWSNSFGQHPALVTVGEVWNRLTGKVPNSPASARMNSTLLIERQHGWWSVFLIFRKLKFNMWKCIASTFRIRAQTLILPSYSHLYSANNLTKKKYIYMSKLKRWKSDFNHHWPSFLSESLCCHQSS